MWPQFRHRHATALPFLKTAPSWMDFRRNSYRCWCAFSIAPMPSKTLAISSNPSVAGLLGHARIHGFRLFALAAGRGFQVRDRVADAVQRLQVQLGVLLLVLRRLQEDRRDLLVTFLLGHGGEVGVLVPGLRFAGERLAQILLRLRAFQLSHAPLLSPELCHPLTPKRPRPLFPCERPFSYHVRRALILLLPVSTPASRTGLGHAARSASSGKRVSAVNSTRPRSSGGAGDSPAAARTPRTRLPGAGWKDSSTQARTMKVMSSCT